MGGCEGGSEKDSKDDSTPEKSTPSQGQSGREGEGDADKCDSQNVTEATADEVKKGHCVSSNNESFSLSNLQPLDPSPGREGDWSVSITSTLPVSSLESCVVTSTPQEREGEGDGDGSKMSLGSVSSVSVGYGGGEERTEERDKKSDLFEERREKGSKDVVMEVDEAGEDEDGDSDATTVAGSDMECEDEGKAGDTIVGTHEVESESNQTSSWRLVCSANTNTCSQTKSSSSEHTHQDHLQNQPALLEIHNSQLTDSLPDSELPLVIDLTQSLASQPATGPSSPPQLTTVVELDENCEDRMAETSASEREKNNKITVSESGERVEKSTSETEDTVEPPVKAGEKSCEKDKVSTSETNGNGDFQTDEATKSVEGRHEGGGIKEAWDLLQRERRNEREKSVELLLSPLKSQQAQELSDDVEMVMEGEGKEGGETTCSQGFSLRLSLSQTTPTQDKATPTPNGATPDVANTEPAQTTNSRSQHTVCEDPKHILITEDDGGVLPKPVYESIGLSESAAFLSSPLPQNSISGTQSPPSHPHNSHTTPSHHQPPTNSPQPPQLLTSQTHTNEISQASSSSAGTQFQFQLPKTGLLRPRQYTSPPSLHTPTPPPLTPLTPSSSPPPISQPQSLAKTEETVPPTGQPTQNSSKNTSENDLHTEKRDQSSGSVETRDQSSKDSSQTGEVIVRPGKKRSVVPDRFYGGTEGSVTSSASLLPSAVKPAQETERDEGGRGNGGFVLGTTAAAPLDEDTLGNDDSQNELDISIAGDSQFETSADSQRLLDCSFIPPPDPNRPGPSLPPRVGNFEPLPTQGSNISSSTTQPSSNLSVQKQQGSIESGVRTSRNREETRERLREATGLGVRRDEDPFEFDSQSHATPAQFVPPRRKRKVAGDGGNGVCEGARGEDGTGEVSEVRDIDQVQITQSKANPCPTSAPVITSSLSPSSQPHSSTPSHPHPVPTPAQQPHTIVGPHTPQSHTLPPSHPHLTPGVTLGSPLPIFTPHNHLPFTSPSSCVSQEQVATASRQYSATGSRYVLRHTHTYRHVVEVKVVSQEVYEGDRVVEGLNTVWQVYTQLNVFERKKLSWCE